MCSPAGITLSPKQVARGTQLAAERGLKNVKFMVSHALHAECILAYFFFATAVLQSAKLVMLLLCWTTASLSL
jgi:hypothetical protein